MQHFYQNIHGWFDFDDIYRAMVELAPANRPSLFVELGTWVGRSAAYMAVEIVNSGKPIGFDCVDSWEGTGASNEYVAQKDMIERGLFDIFLENMAPVAGVFGIRRGLTVDIAQLYPDQSLDFLFVDASHSYDAVLADLNAWVPKVRPGGWIAGHDYYSAPDGVGRAVREKIPCFGTSRASWYSRVGSDDCTPLEDILRRPVRKNLEDLIRESA